MKEHNITQKKSQLDCMNIEEQIVNEIVRLLLVKASKRTNRTSTWRAWRQRMSRAETKLKSIMRKFFKAQRKYVVSKSIRKDIYSDWEFDIGEWSERLYAEGIDFIRRLVSQEGSDVLRRLRLIIPDIGQVSFDVNNPRVAELIRENVINFARQVNETTNASIREAVARGVEAGEGISDIANRVASVFDEAEGYRSELIARTEVIRNSNMAAEECYVAAGIEKKQWYTTPDDALCEECMNLADEIVPVGEAFSSGDYAPPLHPSCRCTIIPVID